MKILISDLDGTLYPKKTAKEGQLERNVEAVKRWVEAGHKFVAASARGLHHYDQLKKNVGVNIDFIGSNGASVKLGSGEEILKRMPIQTYIDIINFIDDNDIDSEAACGYKDTWAWSSKSKYPLTNPNSPYVKMMSDMTLFDRDNVDYSEEIDRIQAWVTPSQIDSVRKQIEDLNLDVEVTTSDVDMIDIGPKNSNKGISIMELADRYNISKEDIIVVGDSENDVSMFEVASRSYCIDHADQKVKDAATQVVASVEEVIDKEIY